MVFLNPFFIIIFYLKQLFVEMYTDEKYVFLYIMLSNCYLNFHSKSRQTSSNVDSTYYKFYLSWFKSTSFIDNLF